MEWQKIQELKEVPEDSQILARVKMPHGVTYVVTTAGSLRDSYTSNITTDFVVITEP